MSPAAPLTRARIRDAVRAALEPLDEVEALIECGSAAFGREDELSDLDLGVVVRDGAVEACFEVLEAALEKLAPIEHVFRPPPGTWADLTQRFYRLEGAGPYRIVDVCVFEASVPDKVDHPEVHGRARVLFDKAGHQVFQPLDLVAERARLAARVEEIADRFEMLGMLVAKELRRGKALEAMGFYQGQVLRPLVELLRIRHAPRRSGFHTRLIHFDLPDAVLARLEPFFFPDGPEALGARDREAAAWIRELVAALRG